MLDLKIISRKEFEKLKKEKRIEIFFGFHETLLGKCLIGLFHERICHLSFVNKSPDSVNLEGTDFEAKVWHALINIPKGETVCYEDVAAATGNEKAVRAAANAVAKNPVAYLVPCHRVIRKNGNLHKYRWGSHVKKKILQFEKCDRLKVI